MLKVYHHWDQLKTCVVGAAYPPEFFDWIKDRQTRNKFYALAEETEQDLAGLCSLLQNKFAVNVIRPQLFDADIMKIGEGWVMPPVTPRDYFLMIHDKLWVPTIPNRVHAARAFDKQNTLERDIFHAIDQQRHDAKLRCYQDIFNWVQHQGNDVKYTDLDIVSGCFVSRLGDDLFFATQEPNEDTQAVLSKINQLFPNTNNRMVDAQGHGDATYCPVTPGLIISLRDISTYADTFPGWEVVYLPPSDYANMRQFESSMKLNKGRWFMPGFDQDSYLLHLVEYYFDTWVGQVSETVFDVNILIVDPKNIVVSSHNDLVEKACARYGIEVHVVPFRHRFFWDAGIHCITNDLDRQSIVTLP